MVSGSTGISTVAISVVRTPKASFSAYFEDAGYPSKLVLTNYSTNSLINYWKFNDVNNVDSTVNTARYFTTPGNYTVTLTARGSKGCSDVSSYAFDIPKYSSVTLPNIFTPNNDDVNEVYRPILVGISQLKARILDRWGSIICSWDKVNGSWDGYTTSGEHCDEGVYFIVVEALGFDGQSYKLKGTITLAR
jgi:gliding motility-associated-like protein